MQLQEVLLPDLTAALGAGHVDECLCAIQSYGYMPSRLESPEIAPRTATEIKDAQGRLGPNVTQKGINVLADVMFARALSKGLCIASVMIERALCRAPRVAHGLSCKNDQGQP